MVDLAFVFGLLGNIISFVVFLAPVPTFYQIRKRNTSDGYQSLPYLFALFSAMLLIYYAVLKGNEKFVVIINSIGCFFETIYILLYFYYAPRRSRIQTGNIGFLMNVCSFGLIVLLTQFVVKEQKTRHKIVGWICLSFSVCVFAAPLAIMRRVIRTKSVEYMPLPLSFFLTLSAIMWFFYGLFRKDNFIAAPNVLGFLFGLAQMILYAIYRKPRQCLERSKQNHQQSDNNRSNNIVEVIGIVCAEMSPVVVPASETENDSNSTMTKAGIVEDHNAKQEIEEIKTNQTFGASENIV